MAHEFLWVASGQLMSVLGALVGIRILTGIVSPEIYGELTLAMTFSTLLTQVIFIPIGQAVQRFLSVGVTQRDLVDFFCGLKKLSLLAVLSALMVSGLLLFVLFLTDSKKWFWMLFPASLYAVFSGLNSILDGLQNAARQRQIVAWHGAIATWGRFLCAAVLILGFGAASSLAMSGYALASVIVLLSQVYFIKLKYDMKNSKDCRVVPPSSYFFKEMSSFAWPVALWGAFGWAQSVADRWALESFASTSDVGLYAVLYQIGFYPLQIFLAILMQFATPIIFENIGDATDSRKVGRVDSLTLVICSGFALFTIAVFWVAMGNHELIFRWTASEAYGSVSWMLPGMVLASGLLGCAQIAATFFQSRLINQELLTPKIATAMLGVALNFAGSALCGLKGVVAANIMFSASYLTWILLLVFKKKRIVR